MFYPISIDSKTPSEATNSFPLDFLPDGLTFGGYTSSSLVSIVSSEVMLVGIRRSTDSSDAIDRVSREIVSRSGTDKDTLGLGVAGVFSIPVHDKISSTGGF